ncbi:poly-gamma-glutamate hydrolase family protein [Streptomyces sp. NK15101]|uniref:poly-gamma-glutamate hydrolase family protein n=1 Tax=Streptomyces sp. NK15101 TaxID=2873261 RepID=UPI001CED4163|nr:poly-gamma-glutamate hydrolase family protein [Streptomyces sp. NK15101]
MTFEKRTASRRTVLTAFAAAATVGAPLLTQLATPTPAFATGDNDIYDDNIDLYTSTDNPVKEGVDYGRRYRRHDQADGYLSKPTGYTAKTAIMAIHGGQIERATSELCLAIAGYDPADVTDPTKPPLLPTVHDYWMFEGMRTENNRDLHVTSVNCNDHVARVLATSHFNVLSLHGCSYDQLNIDETAVWPSTADRRLVVVGGLNKAFRDALMYELNTAGFRAVDALSDNYKVQLADYAGAAPDNICNRTILGKGAQLEITEDMRRSLFGTDLTNYNTRSGRIANWNNPRFLGFRDACRRAIATVEAGQTIL